MATKAHTLQAPGAAFASNRHGHLTSKLDVIGAARRVAEGLFGAEIRRYRTRRGLESMNRHLLKDIGLD